eukprot:Skav231012  [mRNA]  locus=scaffold1196:81571:83453:+ [translate_table: standard]
MKPRLSAIRYIDTNQRVAVMAFRWTQERFVADPACNATEVEPGTTTVLAVGPAEAKQLNAVTGKLKTLPDCRSATLEAVGCQERLQKELEEEKRSPGDQ